jgi:hypothetical protein
MQTALWAILAVASLTCPASGQLKADFDYPPEVSFQLPPVVLESVKHDFSIFREDVHGEDLENCLKEQSASFEQSIKVSHQLIGSERRESLLVQGFGLCVAGATNGSIFLYGNFEGRWRKIFAESGERLTEMKSSSNGWPDLQFSVHDSASSTFRFVYKFNGTQYHPTNCAVVSIPVEEWTKPHPKSETSPCYWNWRNPRKSSGR